MHAKNGKATPFFPVYSVRSSETPIVTDPDFTYRVLSGEPFSFGNRINRIR